MDANQFIVSLRELIAEPTSNLTAAAIGVSIIVLVALILTLALITWVTPAQVTVKKKPAKRKKKAKGTKGANAASASAKAEAKVTQSLDEVTSLPAKQKKPRPKKKRRKLPAWVGTVTVTSLVIAAVAVLYGATSANSYCGNVCHSMKESRASWGASTHRRVSCARCHEGVPVLSAPQAAVSRLESGYYAVSGTSGDARPVGSQNCLSCHDEILTAAVTGSGGVRMSHAEVLAAGASCRDCHGAQGHADEVLITGMNACLRCHDGTIAANECTVCHQRGPEAKSKGFEGAFGKAVSLPEKPTCGGCHSQKKCDACHGIRMPHPPDFSEPHAHARLAAFDKKSMCYRCHAPVRCTECHKSFDAHGPDWKAKHRDNEYNTTYCNWCHDTAEFCDICHADESKGSKRIPSMTPSETIVATTSAESGQP